jgi:hypothetical protein
VISENPPVRTISREVQVEMRPVTPQRPHAELLSADTHFLEAYLQGALGDATYSARHRTVRFGQVERLWLETISDVLRLLGWTSWIYREGRSRQLWVLETSATFLDFDLDPRDLVGAPSAIGYARGFFDAEGGVPHRLSARFYVQFAQKNRGRIESLKTLLENNDVACGKVHQPSARADPDYWRFYVRTRSHVSFAQTVGSWHPRKRQVIADRMKIWSTPHGDMGTNVNKVAVRERAAGSPPF